MRLELLNHKVNTKALEHIPRNQAGKHSSGKKKLSNNKN